MREVGRRSAGGRIRRGRRRRSDEEEELGPREQQELGLVG